MFPDDRALTAISTHADLGDVIGWGVFPEEMEMSPRAVYWDIDPARSGWIDSETFEVVVKYRVLGEAVVVSLSGECQIQGAFECEWTNVFERENYDWLPAPAVDVPAPRLTVLGPG